MAPKPITVTTNATLTVPPDQVEPLGAAITAAGADPMAVLGNVLTGATERVEEALIQPLTAVGVSLDDFPGAGVDVTFGVTGGSTPNSDDETGS